MPIHTRRWNDPPLSDELSEPAPPTRILVTCYRPRGVAKSAETWDQWMPNLGPSRQLHAAVYAKVGQGIAWPTYRARYLAEMRNQQPQIRALAARVAAGQSITLLCSSHCVRESRCHRSLLRELIQAQIQAMNSPASPSAIPTTTPRDADTHPSPAAE